MTHTRPLFWVLLAGCLCTTEAALAQPSEQDIERAGTLFAQGIERFHAKDYTGALAAFQRAYRTAPDYRVLYNIGSTSLLLDDQATALNAFQRYLSEGGDRVPAARRKQIEAHLRRLEQQVVRLRITTNVTGATIWIDGEEVGQTPLSEVLTVSPGQHELVARKDDLPPTRQVFNASPGERHALHLTLVPQPRRGGPEPSPPSPDQPPGRRWTGLWISAGVTGLLAVTAGVLGALTLQASDALDHELAQYPASPDAVEDARQNTRRLSLSTDALLGASVLAAGVTLYFLIGGGWSEAKESSAAPAGVQLTPGPWGLQLRF